MLDDYLAEKRSLSHLTFRKNCPLASYTTFGIGGAADYLVMPETEEALINLIGYLRRQEIRFFLCGNGSNLLFDDKGYRGVVILTKKLRSFRIVDTVMEAAAGASLIAVAAAAAHASLSGLEFASSIPGTVGGALFMNAGAHGGEMKDVVLSSRYLDAEGRIREITEHSFSYRSSLFQENGGIVLSCRLGLHYGRPDEILCKISENRKKREDTQPVKMKSAGSVFRRTESCIPAKLIDEAGLKGLSVGDAAVSEKHAGFIVNRGNATAADVLSLIEKIRERILLQYGKELVCEIRYIPER